MVRNSKGKGPEQKPRRVIIVWSDGEFYNSLAFNNGRGLIRVYYRDQYDSRLDMGREHPLPYFDSYQEAAHWMLLCPDKQCQLELGAALRMGVWDRSEISPVVAPRSLFPTPKEDSGGE